MQRSKVPEDFLSLAGACWQERTFPMQKFYRLSVNIVKILTLLLAVFLFIGSFLTTCYAENMETQQVLLRFDNPLWNLLELAGYGLLFACCLSLSGKTGVKFRRGLLVFTLGLILLLGGMLIVFGRTVPAADALSVYNAAAEWILGNKDIIHPTFSYLSYYPQQIGLMAFLELLLRLWNLTGLSAPAWHFVKLVYVCLLCVAVLFQYRSLRYLWPDDWEPVSCCYLILVCCNLPMILYSSFVYGEIPSFAMLSVGLFLLLKLLADCIPAHSVETTSPDDTRVVGTSHALSAVTVFTALGSILFLTLSVMHYCSAAGAVLRSAASGTQRQGVHRPDGHGSLSYHYLRGSPAAGAEVLREKSRQYLKFRCHRHVLFCHGDAGIFPGMRLVQRLQYRYL